MGAAHPGVDRGCRVSIEARLAFIREEARWAGWTGRQRMRVMFRGRNTNDPGWRDYAALYDDLTHIWKTEIGL